MLTTKQAADTVGVSIDTIRRWADQGKIKSVRTVSGHRRISYESLRKYIITKSSHKDKQTAAYARVSSLSEKEHLNKQIDILESYCAAHGWKYKIISDISSPLDYKRNGLFKLLKMITKESISRLVITNSDRLFIFGNEIIIDLCRLHGVEFVIIGDEKSSLYTKEITDIQYEINNIQNK